MAENHALNIISLNEIKEHIKLDKSKYFFENSNDKHIFDKINWNKLKTEWDSLNSKINTLLNSISYVARIKEHFFINFPPQYKLQIIYTIGKNPKEVKKNLDYTFCDDLTSFFWIVIIDTTQTAIAKFRLFHLSFHSKTPKAIKFNSRGLRPSARHILCTYYTKEQNDEQTTGGALHIKIDNLFFIKSEKQLDSQKTLNKRIVLNEYNDFIYTKPDFDQPSPIDTVVSEYVTSKIDDIFKYRKLFEGDASFDQLILINKQEEEQGKLLRDTLKSIKKLNASVHQYEIEQLTEKQPIIESALKELTVKKESLKIQLCENIIELSLNNIEFMNELSNRIIAIFNRTSFIKSMKGGRFTKKNRSKKNKL
jgi:hypothetical protein